SAEVLHARLLTSPPLCRPAAGGAPAVQLAGVPTIPAADADAPSWVAEHPLVVHVDATEVRLARWPAPGVALPRADRATARRLLQGDRTLYPSGRVAVLRVEPTLAAPDVDGWIGDLARAGYVSVGLTADPGAWLPPGPPTPTGSVPDGPVRTPDDVVVSKEGDFAIRFPPSSGKLPVHVPVQDVRGFERTCADGACELVLRTDAERYLVLRATEPVEGDLTRRWIFGIPVTPYVGPPLRHLRAPTLTGTLLPLRQVGWSRLREAAEIDLPNYAAQRANFLVRPCWLRTTRFRRAFPFLARNPYGLSLLRFQVGPDGGVTDFRIVETDVENRRALKCTLDGMRAIRFPRSPDGAPYSFDMRYRFGSGD
ncbi:MAG: hypothetical protein ACK4YP_19180, partial [Myxococcota bacterium]